MDFFKETHCTCLLNTIFYKHKYITQPMVILTDTIVKAFNYLLHTLQEQGKIKGQQNLDGIIKIQGTFTPPQTFQFPQLLVHPP